MRAPLNRSWSDITEGADEGIGRPRQALAAEGVREIGFYDAVRHSFRTAVHVSEADELK